MKLTFPGVAPGFAQSSVSGQGVVQGQTRQVSDKAKQNIFNEAQSWGINTGGGVNEFYERQLREMSELDIEIFN